MANNTQPSDIDIARNAKIQPIEKIAASCGIPNEYLVQYGHSKAKIKLSLLDNWANKADGIYIDVTAITPTPLGEGKTTTSVGLTQGLGKLGKKAIVCLRQPSLGPTFGIKGGAAGGGYSQVVPMDDFNLHLTGDMHAVSAAHNLIAAALDARLMHERNYSDKAWQKRNLPRLNIDPYQINWRRVVDINDRALRNIMIGLGTSNDGYPRESGFDITPASELMAILALAHNLKDLRQRIGRAIVAFDSVNKQPITVEQLGVAGAATVLLRDAIMPNLMQTLEGQPAFVHAGPFANIAHGNNSIVADLIALKCADYVVTESGFGADMGMEKFFHIKCRASGKMPNVIVLVATVRAIKMHGGGPTVVSGQPLAQEYKENHPELVAKGVCNLQKNIEIAQNFGVPVVVALNRFPNDSLEELNLIASSAAKAGAYATVIAEHHSKGGDGAIELAQAVVNASQKASNPHFLYELSWPLRKKIETVATQVYGAAGVHYEDKANDQIKRWEKIGLGTLPICMAKTQYSFSHNPEVKGVPTGFILPIREVKASAGAGFIYPICGDIQLMPGLPSNPAFMDIDIDEQGNILGLE